MRSSSVISNHPLGFALLFTAYGSLPCLICLVHCDTVIGEGESMSSAYKTHNGFIYNSGEVG